MMAGLCQLGMIVADRTVSGHGVDEGVQFRCSKSYKTSS